MSLLGSYRPNLLHQLPSQQIKQLILIKPVVLLTQPCGRHWRSSSSPPPAPTHLPPHLTCLHQVTGVIVFNSLQPHSVLCL